MASETNELTFVRCPTCRSLVPASASRCRICNATLEAGGEKTSTAEPSTPGSRVRQKTVTASAEEIKSIVGGAAAPPPPVSSTPVQAQPPSSSRSTPAAQKPVDEAFDPLGAFLQDLDSDEPPAPAVSARGVESSGPGSGAPLNKSDEDLIADLFGDDDEDDDDLLIDSLGAAKQEGNDDDDEDDDDDDDFDLFDDPSFEELGATTAKPPGIADEKPASRPAPVPERPVSARPPEPPRRPVPPPREEATRKPESTKPPQGGRDAQKPPRPEQKLQHDVRSPQEQRKQQAPPVSRGAPPMGMRPKGGAQPARPDAKPVRPPPPPVQPLASDESELVDSPRVAPPRPERDSPRFNAEPREERAPQAPQAKQPQQSRQPHPRPHEPVRDQRATARPHGEEHVSVSAESVERPGQSGPRMHKMKPGRLFGWLVSFESPDGRAIELRSGRFFVTGTSIRGSDLILEDQSISTPHALMSINEKGFLLQDLMSERGTFVRSRGEAQYRKEEGIIEVQHGDWIRFGDVEFLVTIVPG
jgi:hypothetical protein